MSQISDFLVAGLQQPLALLLVISTFALCWIADRINYYRRRSTARRREELLRTSSDSPLRRARLALLVSPPPWFTGCANAFVVIFYAWTFVNFYAGHRAAAVRRGEAQRVLIWAGGAVDPLAAAGGQSNWTYLGTVSNYVFVYDHDADRALICRSTAFPASNRRPRR